MMEFHVRKFQPNFFFRRKHFNTLFRFLFARDKIHYQRERITTFDGDFIDLDIASVRSDSLIIAIHGLEGSSQSAYIKALAVKANKSNIDLIAVNLRGCSGEPNRKLYSYHSGKTEDIISVLDYVKEKNIYKYIYLVGYSLGGNMALKFMGEFAETHAKIIQAAVGISVPCDLKAAALTIDSKSNWLYKRGFVMTLKDKAEEKISKFPDSGLNSDAIKEVDSVVEFDEYFTAPANGFDSAFDYYKKSSCKQFISKIKNPTLLITSLDDPFLNEKCYPYKEAKENPNFSLLFPKYGGHVGFFESFFPKKNDWLEDAILAFIQNNHPD